MLKIIEFYVTALILCIFVYKSGKILFEQEKRKSDVFTIFIILLLAIITAFLNWINSEMFNGIIKILIFYLLFCLYYKILFKNTWPRTITVAFICYFAICAAESIVIFLAGIIFNILSLSMLILKNNIISNSLIAILEYLIILIFKNRLLSFVKNEKYVQKGTIIIMTTILITLSLIGFNRPIINMKFDMQFIISMCTLLSFSAVGIYILKQNSDIQKTSSMYQEVVKYSNTTNKLLEDYRMVSHEHKNQLSIIRQMFKNRKDKELIEYIDNLIDKRNDIKYKWAADLNNLPLDGLRGLINYKLLEMEDNKINITVTISKEISKFKNKLSKLNTKEKDNLYSIVGVYLDNAIDATIKSKKRIVGLDIYKENKDIVIVLSNTYSGKIEFKKMDEYGYSTKGKNHGVGLHIVRNILDNSKLFSQNRNIVDEFYVQELRIHTNEIKNKTTK